MKELVFDEDPELLSHFRKPRSDLKSVELLGSKILKHLPHPKNADGSQLSNNAEMNTAEFAPNYQNNDNTAALQKKSKYPPESLFSLQPEK